MKYLRRPRLVGRDTVEYGYFPQDQKLGSKDEVSLKAPYLKAENQARSVAKGEETFYYKGRHYFHCKEGVYEYEPIRWRVFNRSGDYVYLIAERVLFQSKARDERELRNELNGYFRRAALELNDDCLVAVSLGGEKARVRVFAPSSTNCRKMVADARCNPSASPIFKASETLLSGKENPRRLASYYTRDKADETDGVVCFDPSEDGSVDFRAVGCGAGVRPCIVLREKDIERRN